MNDTPQWPDGGARPPVGSVELPGTVHKKHECPPDRAAMFARLQELEKAYNARVGNLKQVVENLSEARQRLLAANAKYESFVRYVADDFTGDHSLSLKAQELLNAQEEGQ